VGVRLPNVAALAPAPPARLGAALFLAALALRPQITSIGPLSVDIASGLGLSHAIIGALTTLPVLFMGLFAPLGPEIARRFGARRALGAALLCVCVFGLMRGLLPSSGWLLGTTLGIGIATGAAGALPQVIAKIHAPSRPARVSGAASAGIVAGAVLASAAAVPLALFLGGWRGALVALAVFGLATTAIGIGMLGPDPREPPAAAGLGTRSASRGWLLAVVFGLQAILYWGSGAWLPGAFVERGWTAAASAGLVATLNAAALCASLLVALLSDRLGHRIVQIRMSAALAFLATLALAVVPDGAVIWTIGLGLSLGAIFPLLLVYTVDLARDAAEAGSLSAFMLLVGYVLAAGGPIGLGIVRDVTGGFRSTVPMLAVVAGILAIAVLVPALAGRAERQAPERT
jgi:MFS transporter, CP family, cyanate transporter